MVILTDLSEVLISGVIGTEKIIGRELGDQAKGKFEKARKHNNDWFLELLRGNISESDYWRAVCQHAGFPEDHIDIITQAFSENLSCVVPGTLDVFKRIIASPVSTRPGATTVAGRPPIYIVSDHIRERLGEIKELHIEVFGLAQDVFWSCNLHKIKADPGLFEFVLHVLGLEPDQCIVIDDSRDNIRAAERVGIQGILFHNAVQLETVLGEYGFEFISEFEYALNTKFAELTTALA